MKKLAILVTALLTLGLFVATPAMAATQLYSLQFGTERILGGYGTDTQPFREDDGWLNTNVAHFGAHTDFGVLESFDTGTSKTLPKIKINLYDQARFSALYQLQQGGPYFFDLNLQNRAAGVCYDPIGSVAACNHIKFRVLSQSANGSTTFPVECGSTDGTSNCPTLGPDTGWVESSNQVDFLQYDPNITDCYTYNGYIAITSASVAWTFDNVSHLVDFSNAAFSRQLTGVFSHLTSAPQTAVARACTTPAPTALRKQLNDRTLDLTANNPHK